MHHGELAFPACWTGWDYSPHINVFPLPGACALSRWLIVTISQPRKPGEREIKQTACGFCVAPGGAGI